MPRISCIMSNYNTQPEYFEAAVGSVLGQSFTDFELIIVDDKSTDAMSRNLVMKFSEQDERVKVLYNDVNMGLANSLNRALEMAQGKYIIRFDTDDICFKDRFYTQYNYMEKTGADIAGSFVQLFDEENRVVASAFYSDEAVKAQLLFSCYIYHPSTVIRRSFMMETGLRYDPSFEKAEDFDFWVRCKEAGAKICMMPNVLLKYRMHKNSVCHIGKNQQTILSEQICKRQLDYMHVRYSMDELELHYILCGLRSLSKADFSSLRQWCKKLKRINHKMVFYGIRAFEKVVDNRLFTAVVKSELCGKDKAKLIISNKELLNYGNIYSVVYKKAFELKYRLSRRYQNGFN